MRDRDLVKALVAGPVVAAQALLGAVIVSGEVSASIVETEAYRASDDEASHAFRGQTARNRVMFGAPGHAYVYFSYGVHWMLNVTCLPAGEAGAVLIRAAKPLTGLEIMRARRGGTEDLNLASGPGKLCQALGITGAENRIDLLADGLLRLEPAVTSCKRILAGRRVGITKSTELPWRFVDADNLAWVSTPKRDLRPI